jgi:hypothetical protein
LAISADCEILWSPAHLIARCAQMRSAELYFLASFGRYRWVSTNSRIPNHFVNRLIGFSPAREVYVFRWNLTPISGMLFFTFWVPPWFVVFLCHKSNLHQGGFLFQWVIKALYRTPSTPFH